MSTRARAGLSVWLSAAALAVLYATSIAAPWFAPYDHTRQFRSMPYSPPAKVRVNPPHRWGESLLFAHPLVLTDTARRAYVEDREQRVSLRWFHRGRLLTTPADAPPVFLLGSDGLGRDLLSRIIHGGRVSLFIGILGVAISFTLGSLLGSFAGYMGGRIDAVIMRIVEIEMSLPSFYFLLALAAAIPDDLSSTTTFFLITALMSFIRWAGFARIIRGMTASLREQDYVVAARALGASRWRILTRHVIPGTFGYTIVAATLSIPGFILGESALSLLGLGIQEPSASWGNLLSDAQNVQNLVRYPWILIPGLFIFIAIMSFNFLGDHLRDRLDPRARV
mgnify:CR=1 FL=1